MAVVKRRGSIEGTQSFSIRVMPEVKQTLENMAYDDRKSLGWFVAELLEATARDYISVSGVEQEKA